MGAKTLSAGGPQGGVPRQPRDDLHHGPVASLLLVQDSFRLANLEFSAAPVALRRLPGRRACWLRQDAMGEYVTLYRFGSECLQGPSRSRRGLGLLTSIATDPVSHSGSLSRLRPKLSQPQLKSPSSPLKSILRVLLVGLAFSDPFVAIRLRSVCSASLLGGALRIWFELSDGCHGLEFRCSERWKIGCL
jgi:hypothetical protein